MSDLKPGYVRVFQCEKCGMVSYDDFRSRGRPFHYERFADATGSPGDPANYYQCGPITERILADPDVVREECVTVISNNTPWDRCHGCEVNLYAKLRALADARREQALNKEEPCQTC